VNDQLEEEGFGGELALGGGREWEDDAAHHEMDGDAVEGAAEEWMFDKKEKLRLAA
jgi:hypothetical protein